MTGASNATLPGQWVARTPERPGPGPTPEALLRALDLTVGRRIRGLLPGEYRAHDLGGGTELAQVRPYEPGDDVRRIDWNVTARTTIPHVRVHVPERALTAWLLLDVSPSMTFGTAERRKADVAEGVAVAIGHLAPAAGRMGLLGLLQAARVDRVEEGTGPTSPDGAMRLASAAAPRGGLVVIVSDFRGPRDWLRSLAALAARHHVIAVEIDDPREAELTDVGELTLIDAETGREVRVDTSSRKLRDRFAESATQERASLATDLRRLGVDHIVLSTAGSWLRTLAGELRIRGMRA
jgi:uncharacterized protein (DUF58 family)